jgi:5'-methylthioadenosine phosphorylase
MFEILGGDVVGMTGGPEAILANELGLRYASIVVATNYAAGLQERVSHDEVERAMERTAPRLGKLLELTVRAANGL